MTAALIIAAGQTGGARRFEPEKEVGTLSALKRSVLTFQMAGVERISSWSATAKRTRRKGASAHMNVVFLPTAPIPERCWRASKPGLFQLRDKCSAVLISHTDVHAFRGKMRGGCWRQRARSVCRVCGGRGGHPIRLSAWMEFWRCCGMAGRMAWPGPSVRRGSKRTRLDVDDEGVLANVRDGRRYEHLIAGYERREACALVSAFRLLGDRPFYDGPGAHQLLRLTPGDGLAMDACRLMGNLYSKGTEDISNLERHMDCSVLERTRGGKTGGTSTVTEAGRALMETYGAFCREARSISPSSFPNIFKKRKRRFPAASPAGKASFFARFGFRKAESFRRGAQ